MTPQEIQKYRNLADKLTLSYVTKLNTTMLSDVIVQTYFMADQLEGFNPPVAVLDKLLERIESIKGSESLSYRQLTLRTKEVLATRQHELAKKVGVYAYFSKRMNDAQAKHIPVYVGGLSASEKFNIVSIEYQDGYEDQVLPIMKDYVGEYEKRSEQIDNINLIFKQDVRREALFSLGSSKVWKLIDSMKPTHWKSVELVSVSGSKETRLTLSGDNYSFSISEPVVGDYTSGKLHFVDRTPRKTLAQLGGGALAVE